MTTPIFNKLNNSDQRSKSKMVHVFPKKAEEVRKEDRNFPSNLNMDMPHPHPSN